MKKFLALLIIILIIAIVGLFVFILTFDVNRYKPLLVEKIENIIQRDVKIGNISLNIFPRPAIAIQGISIKDIDQTWDDVILRIGSMDARVKVIPLIKKDIQIEELIVKGLDITLTKDSISSFSAVNTDTMPAFDIKIDVIEAVLTDVSLYGPVFIDLRASVFGRGMENVRLKAFLYPEVKNKTPYVKNFDIRINLDKISLTSVMNSLGIPSTQQVIGKEIEGELVIRSEEIYFDPKKFYNSNIYVELSNCKTDLVPVKDGIRDVELKAEMNRGDLIIEKFSGTIAGGTFSGQAVVADIFRVQKSDLDVELQGFEIADTFADRSHGKPYIEGVLKGNIKASAKGLTLQKIKDTLVAKGTARLDGPVLRNMNVLKVVLDKIDVLPGLVQKLKQKLPAYYKELLKQNHTTFKPSEVAFNIKDGKVFFEKDITVESDGFYLVGNGNLDIHGAELANGFSDLYIAPELSDAFIDIVNELKYLKTDNGMIKIPLNIYGKFHDIYITPELNYIIQKLAVSKGQELLESIFKEEEPVRAGNETEPKIDYEDEEESQPQEEAREAEPAEVLIKTIFDIISTPSGK
ncbi:MAG: AsmA family protein [Candidatus Omnitrophica bacterium]|nr:AsmA family protein [Candidatus Omnitrophota bacterium]